MRVVHEAVVGTKDTHKFETAPAPVAPSPFLVLFMVPVLLVCSQHHQIVVIEERSE